MRTFILRFATGLSLITIAACETVPSEPVKTTATNGVMTIGEGPIWNQKDAETKCPALAEKHGGTWTGAWTTTVAGSMSVCTIAPKPADFPQVETNYYFDHEQSILHAEARAALTVIAEHLRANPQNIRLEGHTDERGDRSENLGLGERRAKMVSQFLILQGVDSSLIEVVSYGEERPAVAGSNVSAWAKNNRVELKW